MTGTSSSAAEPPGSRRPPFRRMPPLPASGDPGGTAPTLAPQRWAAILDDLRRRGVATQGATVVSAEEVVWNDGSLGCPQPGHSYTQAQMPGQRVVVTVAGTRYDYRFGRGDAPVLCEPGRHLHR